MQQIIKYQQNSKGLYDVVITNVEIPEQAIDLLNLGRPIDVDCSVIDPNSITGKQRRLIFALCNDIEAHTGQPRDYMRQMFQDYVKFLYGYEQRISLADCTRTIAKQIINVMFEWIFTNGIPLNYKTSEMMKEDKNYLYWATVTRHCVICGKHGELAHHKAIGRGANRRKMDHYGYEVLCLCREHHQSQHDMGVESFDKLYHLENSWIPVDERLNRMLKGEKANDR
ncbi:putative HNHc nuclease [Staphylococcus sp. FR124]|uniref:putative HNHc nuclease n=1 Tax=Staphylococcus sp. FR124 TaxID=2923499 RepID=UPI00280F00F5|nr:putative HNHc nuclease [Staphylococcus sp. FR124]MDQ8624128.1 putative HNHc nuclease [Staphylococcus sp. FR124]